MSAALSTLEIGRVEAAHEGNTTYGTHCKTEGAENARADALGRRRQAARQPGAERIQARGAWAGVPEVHL